MSARGERQDPRVAPDLSYAEALAAIESRGRYGVRLGLGRVRALLRAMGDPQLAVRGALVAGTNGKGSVIALAGSALRAAGYRVGETPKPHLVTYRERIVVDGRPIDAGSFARLVGTVIPLADRISPRLGPPTEFELLTAVMFRHFADARLDVALVEVGLGGRLDATHAWDGGVAVITNVGLDHTDRLGTTVTAIAREKAAIIERGDVAVTGATGDALTVVRRRSARMGVPLTIAEPAPILDWDRDAQWVELPGLGATAVALRGRHQAANVAVADSVLDALETAGIARVPADARRRGYASATWPGRLELVQAARPGGGTREVLLDGAHNPDGALALAQALADLRPYLAGGGASPPRPLVLVWASMADKDVRGVLAAVAASPAVADATIVCTTLDLPRALPAAALADAWRAALPGGRVLIERDPAAALDLALATGDGPVVVAGSLYLVGAARARLVDDPALRDPVAA
ncbi:MAG TPA: cyanophycin synthetase [Candidatus Limnocylindrales bacterium]